MKNQQQDLLEPAQRAELPPRPDRNDPAILERAAKKILPEVITWLPPEERVDVEEEVLGQLMEALRGGGAVPDGYKLAKYLDRKGWYADAALVEILDGMGMQVAEAHREAIKAWVKETGIQPGLKIGDRCEITVAGTPHIGTVSKIVLDVGRYVVYVPGLGHVPEGQAGTPGVYKNWEEADS